MIHHWSLFTKPWKTATAEELGALAARLGFTGIEFPLRAGYQVDLADAERGLVSLGKTLAQYGVRIPSGAAIPASAPLPPAMPRACAFCAL